jgi:hypothetical protein
MKKTLNFLAKILCLKQEVVIYRRECSELFLKNRCETYDNSGRRSLTGMADIEKLILKYIFKKKSRQAILLFCSKKLRASLIEKELKGFSGSVAN